MNIKIKRTEAVLGFGFFILLTLLNLSCEFEELTARQIVENAVEAHGGSDNWKKIESLEFQKRVVLYHEDGSIERETNQVQHFEFSSQLKGSFRDLTKPGIQSFSFDGKDFWETTNDSVWKVIDENRINALSNSFYAAQYVTTQPFELLQPSVHLTYLGVENINGKDAHRINVTYKGDDENSDKWSFYFETNTFECVANKVERTDHTSLIENLTFDRSTDFIFNATRKSYRLNEEGEKTYLRADYWYTNYQVTYQE